MAIRRSKRKVSRKGAPKTLASKALKQYRLAVAQARSGRCGPAKKNLSAAYRVVNRIAVQAERRRSTPAESKLISGYPKFHAAVHKKCTR